MSTVTRLTIVGGDNKLEMFQQLLDIGRIDWSARPHFKLVVQHPRLQGKLSQIEIGVHLLSISAEDGSGNCWIIEGTIRKQDLDAHPWLQELPSFRGFYMTHKRQGGIESL